VNRVDDPRAKELGHLKLALATFALHLEAFEMRTQEVMHSVGGTPNYVPDTGMGHKLSKIGLSGRDDLSGGQ